MANPVAAKYTVQIGPTYTVETAAELTAWAKAQGRSVSAVTRECTEVGLEILRKRWEAENGKALPEVLITEAMPEVAARGDRQAERKRKVARDAAAAKVASDAKPVRRRRAAATGTSG